MTYVSEKERQALIEARRWVQEQKRQVAFSCTIRQLGRTPRDREIMAAEMRAYGIH